MHYRISLCSATQTAWWLRSKNRSVHLNPFREAASKGSEICGQFVFFKRQGKTAQKNPSLALMSDTGTAGAVLCLNLLIVQCWLCEDGVRLRENTEVASILYLFLKSVARLYNNNNDDYNNNKQIRMLYFNIFFHS